MSRIYSYAFSKAVSDYIVDPITSLSIIKECIDLIPSFDINYDQSDALITAIRHKDYQLVKLLVENGINVNIQNDQAIITACLLSTVDILKLLISYGADPTARNNEPICVASRIDIIQILMDSGANPFAQNNRPFCNACRTQNLPLVKFLIEIKANCTEPNNKPICLAFYNYGYIELKKLLLDNGADPNAIIVDDEYHRVDCGEKYILDRAICNCDLASCELLLEYGADIELCQIKSKYSMVGPPPSNYYYKHEDEQKIINLLKNHGLDIDNSIC